jgi:hypothetical protein
MADAGSCHCHCNTHDDLQQHSSMAAAGSQGIVESLQAHAVEARIFQFAVDTQPTC